MKTSFIRSQTIQLLETTDIASRWLVESWLLTVFIFNFYLCFGLLWRRYCKFEIAADFNAMNTFCCDRLLCSYIVNVPIDCKRGEWCWLEAKLIIAVHLTFCRLLSANQIVIKTYFIIVYNIEPRVELRAEEFYNRRRFLQLFTANRCTCCLAATECLQE